MGIAEEVSPKESVSPSVETTSRSETVVEEKKTEVVADIKEASSIDDMDRDQLEALAVTVLSEDFEESEIEEMGTKKLKRLVKEAMIINENLEKKPLFVKEESEPEDPKEALKKKLRERVNS